MRVLLLVAAILLCAATAEAQYGYGYGYDPGYSAYSYDGPNWGYFSSPYGMQSYNRVGRFTFYSNYPTYAPYQFYQPTTPIVVPGYGYGGYRHSRHLGF